METFATLLSICAGNSPVPAQSQRPQRPVTRSFDVFFDLRLNHREAGGLRGHRAHYDVTVMFTHWSLNRPQTITRKINDSGHWRIYASSVSKSYNT